VETIDPPEPFGLSEATRVADARSLIAMLGRCAPIGLAMITRDLRIERVNDLLAGINECVPSDLVGRRLPDCLPETWEHVGADVEWVLATGEPLSEREIVRTGPDGRPLHWLAGYYPVVVDGEVVGVGVVGLDISARRHAEQFRSVVMDTMAEGVLVVGAGNRLMLANAAAAAMLGYEAEALVGLPVHRTIHFQHADGTPYPEEECELLSALRERRTVRVAEDAFTRLDGTIMPVSYSAAPMRYDDDEGVVVVFRDISAERAERDRTRRQLDALSWVGRVRDALDEERFVLHVQPIFGIGGERVSEELLIRMVGRDGELIAPGLFLPAAERYGLIAELDRWVVARAAQIAAGGRRVQVNLSAASVADTGLLAFICQQLSAAGAAPADLVFEITETALMTETDAGERLARGLTDLGCGVALDDFGTGFGSFTYLKRLPISALKIDREFVRHLDSNPANQHLVKAIISLAHAFGLQTIAEGVEDDAALSLLHDYGVDQVQGFLLGRPAPLQPAT
jgi:PAS domain S-box-containing protein